MADFFIELGNLRINKNQTIKISDVPNYAQMSKAAKLLPVITSTPELPPLNLSHLQSLAKMIESSGVESAVGNFFKAKMGIGWMERFGKEIRMTDTGITGPKIVHVFDSLEVEHKFIVKGGDDLRQDAVIEQLFCLLNQVSGLEESAQRNAVVEEMGFAFVPIQGGLCPT